MNFTDFEKMTAKLAWNFSKDINTVEDLISIGKVEFYLSLPDFDPTKGASFQTYFYRRAHNAMVNFIKDHNRHTQHADIEDYDQGIEIDRMMFMDSLKTLSKESQEVVQVILDNPTKVFDRTSYLSPKKLRGAVASILAELGWNKPYIYRSFKEIRAFINQVN